MRSASGSSPSLIGSPPVSPMMFACRAATVSSRFAVARDQDRHVGQVLAHVLGHVLQVVDALASAGVRQFGGLELLAHVARAEAQLEPAAGEVTQRRHVAGQQRRLVEARR